MSKTEDEKKLIKSVSKGIKTGAPSIATLATDDRVLARITDGIYRQPASALRELIANAYDADATNVFIQTDRPRFSRISVRDDGNGLTIEQLARLIYHIGGSSKRTLEGGEMGVARSDDPSLSPSGRRLIGKIGIGLFSVAQLTRHFQIISKTRDTDYRLVAEVILKTYTEDDLSKLPTREKASIQTGTVRIRTVSATDITSHGTEIILLDLRPQTRDLLRSKDTWMRIDADDDTESSAERRAPPSYHIGRIDPLDEARVKLEERLPWNKDDPPESRFGKLFQAIVDEVGQGESRPKLDTTLDNYLQMLWTLSLSAPIDYIEKHPFDLASDDGVSLYRLANDQRGQAAKISLNKGESLRKTLNLHAPERGNDKPFNVFVDDIKLLRPLRFHGFPETAQAIKNPMLFVGKAEPDLSLIAKDERGGDLSFEAYFFIVPKVVPKEHNGLLIRISDASGTLFDETFLKYQVSELVRLRQITAEIFVRKGLDAALNIDRESFNFAHPHFQYIVKWVHRALRQLMNTHKSVASEARNERKRTEHETRANALTQTVQRELKRAGVRRQEDAPPVIFSSPRDKSAEAQRKKGNLVFDRTVVFAETKSPKKQTAGTRAERDHFERQIAALAQLLEAFGVFEDMPYARQQELLRAIVAIFNTQED